VLNQKNRLKNRVAFFATYKQNHSVSDGLFVLYTGRLKENNEETKFGFVVSKKIHNRATKRNYIKRRLRESVRLLLKDGYNSKYLSLIFVAKSNSLNKSFLEIKNSVSALISKAENS